MATHNINWTDKQWFAFICGFRAGLTVADLNAPYYRIDTMLHPFGLGGPNERALVVGNTEYDGDGEYVIPVYTYNMTFAKPMTDFSGFTARIDISDPRLGFIGLEAGSFDPSTNLTYQILPGNHLLAQGLPSAEYIERDTNDPVDYSLQDLKDYGPLLYSTSKTKPLGSSQEMEILFYLRLSVTGGVDSLNPINIPLIYKSGTIDSPNVEEETTTLLTFLKGSDVPGTGLNPNHYYMYFVTPILAKGGQVLSEIPPVTAPIGPSAPVEIKASPTCIYASTVYTPKSWPAVMGLYVNPNPDDLENSDIMYVTATFKVESKPEYAITRWTVQAGRGWEIQQTYTTDINEDGEFYVYVNAKRVDVEDTVITGMFAYIIATILYDETLYIPVIPIQGTIYYWDGGEDNG